MRKTGWGLNTSSRKCFSAAKYTEIERMRRCPAVYGGPKREAVLTGFAPEGSESQRPTGKGLWVCTDGTFRVLLGPRKPGCGRSGTGPFDAVVDVGRWNQDGAATAP